MKNIKKMIREGRPVFGAFLGIPSTQLLEIIALNGFDFVIIDEEHGTSGVSGDTENLILAAEASDIYPVVRPPVIDQGEILRPLDMGARGIQVPQTSTREQVETAVKYAKYPPLGVRGSASSTRSRKYGFMKGSHVTKRANEDTMVIIHIENNEGVSNVKDIVNVEGVDCVFIGMSDLASFLGHPGEVNHPDVEKVVKQVINICLEANVPVGTIVSDPETAQKRVEQGVTYLTTGIVGPINNGCQSFLEGVFKKNSPFMKNREHC